MIITKQQLYDFSGDANPNSLDDLYIASAQNVVEIYLGYAIESDDYFYDDAIKSDFVELEAPIDTIETITLNDLPFSNYKIQGNYLIFPYKISGELYIAYTGGFAVVPELIQLSVLQIAAKMKSQSGMAINANSFSMPDGANVQFQPQTENNFMRYLYPIQSYRIVSC